MLLYYNVHIIIMTLLGAGAVSIICLIMYKLSFKVR